MLISETKLRIFALLGIFYLVYSGLSNKRIDCLELIIINSFSMLILFIILYSINYISFKLIRINSLGIGYIKLSSISALWLGIKLSLISLCISFIISAIYSLHGKLFRQVKAFHQYQFAPFLSIGIFCSWFLNKI